MQPPQIDLFCRVIDNLGDVGVCWRLARRMAQGQGLKVRLWVDDLNALQRLAPHIRPQAEVQPLGQDIELHRWHDAVSWPQPAPLVIEAFACELPAAFVARMPADQRWYNLEYLSAESWVEACHGLPSPQPGGRQKVFWFPGFTEKTGGLLCEPNLLKERTQWQADSRHRDDLLRGLGVPRAALREVQTGERKLITMFSYANAPGAQWLEAWAEQGPAALILLAGGTGEHWVLPPNNERLCLQSIPMLSQPDYDRLLWSADLNIVRGEDSFVRAQWAAKPLIWHIYPQAEGVHLHKLDAWIERSQAPATLAAATRAWNTPHTAGSQQPAAIPDHQTFEEWQAWAQRWHGSLLALPELADSLLAHAALGLEYRAKSLTCRDSL